MERAKLIEMIETGGCAGLDVVIMEALGLKYNGEVLDSLDVAVALVERVRPKKIWTLQANNDDGQTAASIWLDFGWTWTDKRDARAPTPAAALIAALLKAEG